VIERFQQLFQQANREESALVSLENSLAQLELEQARQTLPWELISTPTMLPSPVAPRRGRTLALGLLAGLVLGGGAALVVDRRSGVVYATDELESEIPAPLLAELTGDANDNLSDDNLALLAQGPLAGATNLGLIPLGLAASEPALQHLHQSLQQLLPQCRVQLCRNLIEAAPCSHQVVIIRAASIERDQLRQFRQQAQLQARPLTGWLLLPPTSNAV
jgi:hypothetical protein